MQRQADPNHALDARTAQSLSAALDRLAAETRNVTPPSDLEARMLARAEAEHLFVKRAEFATRSSGGDARRWASLLRFPAWFSGWAWAPATAAIALLLWAGIATWRDFRATVPSQPEEARVATATETPASGASARKESPSPEALAAEQTAASKPFVTASKSRRARVPHPADGAKRTTTAALASPAGATVVAETVTTEAMAPQSQPSLEEFAYTAFVPLAMEPALRPNEFAQAVRVRVEPEELWRLGLSVPPVQRGIQQGSGDRVFADFLVGEDGRPRAVRLVSSLRD